MFAPHAYDWGWSAVVLLVLAGIVAAVVQINRRSDMSAAAQLAWTLVVLVLPLVGSVAWFVLRPRPAT